MYRRVIEYMDYDGNMQKGEFFFNLTKTELMEMNYSESGGMEKMLQRIVETNDVKKLIAVFKDLILRSYGEKSDDGKRFIKMRDGHRLSDDFSQTEAFSELFMDLATNEDSANEFIRGIVPKSVADEVASR